MSLLLISAHTIEMVTSNSCYYVAFKPMGLCAAACWMYHNTDICDIRMFGVGAKHIYNEGRQQST